MQETHQDPDHAIIMTSPLSAEELRLQQRAQLALTVIDRELPPNTLEQYTATALGDYEIDSGDVEGHEHAKQAAERWTAGQDREREGGAYFFASLDVSDEELEAYVASTCHTARLLTPASKAFVSSAFYRFAEGCDNAADAQLREALAASWLQHFTADTDTKTTEQRQMDAQEVILRLTESPPRSSDVPTHAAMHAKAAALTDVYESAYRLDRTVQAQSELFDTVTGEAGQLVRIGSVNALKNIQTYRQLFERVREAGDPAAVGHLLRGAAQYGYSHAITQAAIEGWTTKLLPALEAGDEQVALLYDEAQVGGKMNGRFGVADFIYHAYGQPVTPHNVNELLSINREVSTTSAGRFEQLRLDALTLGEPFGAIRDFIHDQSGDTHQMVRQLIRYYESGEAGNIHSLAEKIGPDILNRDLYDKPVYEVRADGNPREETIAPIDVLRRVAETTATVTEAPPKTSDEKLNELLTRLQGARHYQRWDALQAVLGHLNTGLVRAMHSGSIGVEPAMIEALAWTDHQAMNTLQSLVFEDQVHAYRQPWFHEILKFQELIASGQPFDETKFQVYVESVVDERSFQEAYKKIMEHTLANVSDLAEQYRAAGTPHRSEGLWSANTVRQLIGLVDLKPAETKAGSRQREEMLTHVALRHTGD